MTYITYLYTHIYNILFLHLKYFIYMSSIVIYVCVCVCVCVYGEKKYLKWRTHCWNFYISFSQAHVFTDISDLQSAISLSFVSFLLRISMPHNILFSSLCIFFQQCVCIFRRSRSNSLCKALSLANILHI